MVILYKGGDKCIHIFRSAVQYLELSLNDSYPIYGFIFLGNFEKRVFFP
jgi:hypothetical protein